MRPLLWLSAIFLLGIVFGAGLPWPAKSWVVLLVLVGLGLLGQTAWRILARRQQPQTTPLGTQTTQWPGRQIQWTLIALVVLCFGALRYQLAQPTFDSSNLAWYNEHDVFIEGLLDEPPDARDNYVNLRIKVDRLGLSERGPFMPVSGLLLARTLPGGDWRYGDRLSLRGKLATPSETDAFSYRDYLARQGVYSEMRVAQVELLGRDQGSRVYALIYGFKENAFKRLYQIFPDPEASLLAGILLGVDTGIPDAVQQAFRDTGTAHIIAISGFNISILITIFAAMFGWLLGRGRTGARRGAFVAGLAIALYTLLVGPTPSVVRAAIMGGVALLGRQLGRQQDGLNTLVFVAALMCGFNPNLLWDVGFQLSFTATLGLILYAEPFTQAFIKLAGRFLSQRIIDRLVGPVGEYCLLTLAAQLTTLPVTLYHFRRLSLIALLANPLILPAQPPVMILGGLALLTGMLYPQAGQWVGYLAWPFTAYTVRLVEGLAKVPLAAVDFGWISGWVSLACYVLLFGFTFLPGRIKRGLNGRQIIFGRLVEPVKTWFASRSIKSSPVLIGVILLGLLAANGFVWQLVFHRPDGHLHLTVLDVNANGASGEALLLGTPSGRYILINGGPSPRSLSDALGRRLPLAGRRLDFLVVAGTAEGQLAGLPENLDRFPPRQVWWAGELAASRSARILSEAITARQIPLTQAEVGQALDLGNGAQLRLLAATKGGGVLLLEWNRLRILLPVGLDVDSLAALAGAPILKNLSVLLLAGGGLAADNPPTWINSLQPQLLLLSVASGDRNGLPNAEAIRAAAGYTLLRTDQNGWIHLSSDGKQMWIEVERP